MKAEFKPVDLGHLEEKAVFIVDAFRKANDPDRSPEYRKHHLGVAEQISKTLVSDFGYYFDKYIVGGVEPYGLSQKGTNDKTD
jgi:hypothetical protein